jgi:hypothetical protein
MNPLVKGVAWILVIIGKFVLGIHQKFKKDIFWFEARFGAVRYEGRIKARNPDDALHYVRERFIRMGHSNSDFQYFYFKKIIKLR